jgi:hypothetical protein
LWPAIKADARHVKDEDALNYAGDSWSSMNLAHIFDDPMNKVKGYKPSLIKDVHISELEAQASTAVGVGLFALSVEYVGSLGVAPVAKRDMKNFPFGGGHPK